MSDRSGIADRTLSPSEELWLNDICDQAERAWKARETPRIEPFLDGATPRPLPNARNVAWPAWHRSILSMSASVWPGLSQLTRVLLRSLSGMAFRRAPGIHRAQLSPPGKSTPPLTTTLTPSA
jgi:hypothetical protein